MNANNSTLHNAHMHIAHMHIAQCTHAQCTMKLDISYVSYLILSIFAFASLESNLARILHSSTIQYFPCRERRVTYILKIPCSTVRKACRICNAV